MAGWFDSHCHVQDEYLGDESGGPDLEPLMARAREAGIDGLVCIGTGVATSRQAVDVARATARTGSSPRAWASIGLHPHEASQGVDEVAALLAREVSQGDGAVVAVGECGLDYHYEHSPRADQRAAFASQIGLAHAHDLALVIHARDAWPDLFDVLDAEGVPERTVLHCFTGGTEEADRCLRAGMYISFSGIVTFKNAAGVPRRGGAVPAGPFARRDRQPVPGAGAASRSYERTVVPAVRRRGHRSREGLQRRRGEGAHGRGCHHGVFHRQLIHALLCVIREPRDQGVSG